MCGYIDGPYAYACDKGCCSEDCSTTRGTLVESTFQTPANTTQWEMTRRNIRRMIFGDSMPLIPMILVVILASIMLIALGNILKEKRR
mgnify:CR=1 FL=1